MLERAATHLARTLETREEAHLLFICTHNSRRSQMAQVWAQTAAWLLGLSGVHCHSGGTEATAFNHHAIDALRTAGFEVETGAGNNPLVQLRWSDDIPPLRCWSKTFHEALPEGTPFTAVMTCSEADEACPVVPGAEARFPIRYEDPKASDGSGREAEVYLHRCLEIGQEMLCLMQAVAERT
jgi:arsenate reductase